MNRRRHEQNDLRNLTESRRCRGNRPPARADREQMCQQPWRSAKRALWKP